MYSFQICQISISLAYNSIFRPILLFAAHQAPTALSSCVDFNWSTLIPYVLRGIMTMTV